MLVAGDRPILRPSLLLWPATVAVLGATSLAACGAGGSGATAGGATAEGATTRGAAGAGAGGQAATGTSAPQSPDGSVLAGGGATTTTASGRAPSAVLPTCPATGLRVSFDVQPTGQPQRPDRTRALIVVTNTSASACTIGGFVVIDAIEGGAAKPLDARRVDQPGKPIQVVLEAGGSAYAGMEWTSTEGCPDVSVFRLVPPGQVVALPVAVVVPGGLQLPLDVCAAGIEVGPLAATSQGTVAFPDSDGDGS